MENQPKKRCNRCNKDLEHKEFDKKKNNELLKKCRSCTNKRKGWEQNMKIKVLHVETKPEPKTEQKPEQTEPKTEQKTEQTETKTQQKHVKKQVIKQSIPEPDEEPEESQDREEPKEDSMKHYLWGAVGFIVGNVLGMAISTQTGVPVERVQEVTNSLDSHEWRH